MPSTEIVDLITDEIGRVAPIGGPNSRVAFVFAMFAGVSVLLLQIIKNKIKEVQESARKR